MKKTIVSTQILGRMTYEIADMLNGCSQGKNKKFSSGKDLSSQATRCTDQFGLS